MNARIRLMEPDEAIAAARAAAFATYDGREVVHSFLSGWCGADWDLASVVDLIEGDPLSIAWVDSWVSHDLEVVTREGKVYTFAVKRPVTHG